MLMLDFFELSAGSRLCAFFVVSPNRTMTGTTAVRYVIRSTTNIDSCSCSFIISTTTIIPFIIRRRWKNKHGCRLGMAWAMLRYHQNSLCFLFCYGCLIPSRKPIQFFAICGSMVSHPRGHISETSRAEVMGGTRQTAYQFRNTL